MKIYELGTASAKRYTDQECDLIESRLSATPFEPDEEPKFICIVKGYASTPSVDAYNEIVLPSAFARTIDSYMRYPVVLAFHDMGKEPVAKTLKLEIHEGKGLYFEAGILDTAHGRDIATCIKAGVLRGVSIGFGRVEFAEAPESGKPAVIVGLRLYEYSFVNVPANFDSFITEISSKQIPLNTYRLGTEAGQRGVRTMSEQLTEGLKQEIHGAVRDSVATATATITEVKTSQDAIQKALVTAQDSMKGLEKDGAEAKQRIDAISADMKKLLDVQAQEIREAKDRKTITAGGGSLSLSGYSAKQLINLDQREVKGVFRPEDTARIQKMQELHDRVILSDGLLRASSSMFGGDYHTQPRSERIKQIPYHKEFMEFAKAMDTATSGEGSQWTFDQYGANLKELVRVSLKVAANLDKIQVQTAVFKNPVLMSDTIATLAGETTAIVSAFNTVEQTPTSYQATWTGKKARARIQISAEITLDTLFAVVPRVEKIAALSLQRALETALINGDTTGTHQDSNVTASTDFQKAFIGWRKATLTAAKVDLGTFSLANLRVLRSKLGKYGLMPSEMMFVTSIRTYLTQFLTLAEVKTLDLFGPNAVVLTGELGKIDGISIVISEFERDNLNATGVYDGTTTTKSALQLVHRPSWTVSEHGPVRAILDQDWKNDVMDAIAYARYGFACEYDSSTEACVANGYNIA